MTREKQALATVKIVLYFSLHYA